MRKLKMRREDPRLGSQTTPRLRVVIAGRPNVGKSTLFNRLYGRRRALVHDMPGVTRDRLEERTLWFDHGQEIPVALIDTGGLGGEFFADEIAEQVTIAVESADVILFVVDGQMGVTPQDESILKELQISGVAKRVPMVVVVNKVDVQVHEDRIHDFYSLGLENVVTISAEHGRGIDDLKTLVLELTGNRPIRATASDDAIPEHEPEQDDDDISEIDETDLGFNSDFSSDLESEIEEPTLNRIPRITVVGKPNVGKSTFINALLGEKRMIVSPIAGTTIDSIDSEIEFMRGDEIKKIIFVDTAGIRRKSKTEQGVEVLSVVQTRKALERCDVALLVMDGELGVTDQDEKISGLIEEVGCSVVLVLNKWDTQQGKKGFERDVAAEIIRKKMAYLKYAPLMFISAKQGKGFDELPELIEDILTQRQLKLTTKELTQWIREESKIHNPKDVKFYYCHQSGRHPPTFVCHVSEPKKIHYSLSRHFLNAMREKWGFMGSPIRLHFVKSENA